MYARFEAFVALLLSSGFAVGDAHLIGVSAWDPLAAVRCHGLAVHGAGYALDGKAIEWRVAGASRLGTHSELRECGLDYVATFAIVPAPATLGSANARTW